MELVKKRKGGFLGVLFRTLGESMLGNMLTGKGVMNAGRGYNNMDYIDKIF